MEIWTNEFRHPCQRYAPLGSPLRDGVECETDPFGRIKSILSGRRPSSRWVPSKMIKRFWSSSDRALKSREQDGVIRHGPNINANGPTTEYPGSLQAAGIGTNVLRSREEASSSPACGRKGEPGGGTESGGGIAAAPAVTAARISTCPTHTGAVETWVRMPAAQESP